MNKLFKTNFNVLVMLTLLIPSLAQATNGYFSHGWGMKSKAMAGAGIANAEDALVAANNPAGMVIVGNRVDVGLDLFSPDRSATISGAGANSLNQTVDGNEDDNFLIPEFGYNQMINDNMSFGVSVYGNGGMNTRYKNGLNYFASVGPAGVDLAQLFIAPTIAVKMGNKHAFGISLNLAYQTFEAFGIQGFCNPSFSSNKDKCTNNGVDSSTGSGFSLGYLGRFNSKFALGVSYRSRTYMSKFDKYSGLFAEQGDFDIPSMYGIGMKLNLSKNTAILFDYTRINYTEIAAISNSITNLTQRGQRLGTDNGGGFGWKDMKIYKLAIAYQVNTDLVFRAGWNYGAQPIPVSETLFNILAPATVEYHLTLGATWVMANHSELTVSYMHAFENEMKGSGSIPTGGGFAGGEADLTMSQDSLGIAYGWAF